MTIETLCDELEELIKGSDKEGWRQAAFESIGLVRQLLTEIEQLKRETADQDVFGDWIESRIEWLTKEISGGGNFEHLNTRRSESSYILEKWKAAKPKRG